MTRPTSFRGGSFARQVAASVWLVTVAIVFIEAQSSARRPPARSTPPATSAAESASANTWLVWGGPNRDFKSPSTGLATTWPAAGPKKAWSRPLGEGYSAVAVEGSRLYTMYRQGTREVVVALDAGSGKTLWEYPYESPFDVDVGPGPYAMPQVVGDRIVSVGSTGKLHSIDKKTGKPVWSHDLYADYGGTPMRFGYSCHALPYKDTLIMMVGGSRSALMSFKQADGATVWGKHRFANSHSSPLLIKVDGQDQVVALMGQQVVSVEPNTGELLWQHTHPTQYDLAVSTPSWGSDNVLIVSSSYEGGTRALHLTQSGGKTKVDELWHNTRVRVHFGTMIRVGDTLYGSSGHDGPAPITAVDVKSGQVLWNSGREFAKSQLVLAGDKLIILDQDGVLALATVSREGLKVLSKVGLLERVAWSPPTLVGTRLYVRDRKTLMALDLG